MLLDWVVEKASWQNVTVLQKLNTLLLFLHQNGPKWIFDQKCRTAYEYNRQKYVALQSHVLQQYLTSVILVSTRILYFSVVTEDLAELILFLIEKSCTYHDTSIFLNSAPKSLCILAGPGIFFIWESKIQGGSARRYMITSPVSSHMLLTVTFRIQQKKWRKKFFFTDFTWIHEWPKWQERK